MERHVVKRGQLPLFALLAASGLGGCFDVGTTNLRVIDNFNQGRLQPVDPGFGTWTPYLINACPNSTLSSGIDADPADTEDGSAGSLLLDVTVTDPGDDLQQHGGGGLATQAGMGAVDFTRYDRIGFDIRLQSGGVNPLPATALVYLELGCSSVPAESMAVNDLYVVQGVPYSDAWHNFGLTMGNFGPPPWLVEAIKGGTTACLQNVDSIRFTVDEQLADGKTGEAILHLDNIVLE